MAWRIELFDEAADLGGRESEIAYVAAFDDQAEAFAALRSLCECGEIFVAAMQVSDAEVSKLDLKPGEVRRVKPLP